MSLNKKSNLPPEEIPGGLVWRFGSAGFDESRWELKVAGPVVELEPRPLTLLQQLLRQAGELLTHDVLLDAVYGRRHITEGVIAGDLSGPSTPPPAPALELKAGDVIPHRPHWNLVKPLGNGGAGVGA